jgi:hypothetical protein
MRASQFPKNRNESLEAYASRVAAAVYTAATDPGGKWRTQAREVLWTALIDEAAKVAEGSPCAVRIYERILASISKYVRDHPDPDWWQSVIHSVQGTLDRRESHMTLLRRTFGDGVFEALYVTEERRIMIAAMYDLIDVLERIKKSSRASTRK